MLQRHVRAMLFALALVCAMATAGAAQASRGINFSATTIGASGRQTFNGIITCDVLLSITLNSSTLPKTTGTTQGTLGGGYIRNCTGQGAGTPNTGQILGTLPIQYRSFSGTLPSITVVRLLAPRFNFGINTLGGFCLYEGSNTLDFNGRTSVTPDRSAALPKVSGGFLCPNTGTLTGPLTTWLPSAPAITLV